jgi:uncharacterized protein (DUF58 family)
VSVRRSLLIGLIIYGLIFAGLAFLNAALLAAALPLVLYVGLVLMHQPRPLQLRITRVLERDYIMPDVEIGVKLTVENLGAKLDEVVIREGVPANLAVDGDTSVMVELDTGARCTLEYKVKAPRGVYRFTGPGIAAREHFALFQRKRNYDVITKLSVLPRPPQLRSIGIRPFRTRGFAGPILARQAGSGTDFFGVRAYEPGDPMRWINWRISARHPRDLYTNEFERERIADVGLILDARERTNIIAGSESLFEHSVRATAGLAETFLADGNHVGLLIYGRGLERTHPGYGKLQRQSILRALASARVGDSLVFDSLDYLPTRFFAAKSQLVLISPLCEDDPAVLSRLRARGYQVLVISPDPINFEQELIEPGVARDLAVRLARAERALWIRQLERVGIQVISWRVDQPLDPTVQAGLKKTILQPRRL